MKNVTLLASASVFALLFSAPAFAQGAMVGIDSMNDDISDIQTAVDDEFAKGEDANRFGSNQYTQGWTGSVSLGLSLTSGNSDSQDLSFGGRYNYGSGPWNHTIGFAGAYASDEVGTSKQQVFATYDVNRYFSDNFYVFGLGSVNYDLLATNEIDAFLGVGPGYRVINNENVTWRLQAGPGVRYIRDNIGDTATEVAGIASSRLYYKLSDTMFLTNDTDVLYSEASTRVVNDIGMTLRMTDNLSTRVGYRTEYDSDPLPGLVSTDNTLGVSVVFGF